MKTNRKRNEGADGTERIYGNGIRGTAPGESGDGRSVCGVLPGTGSGLLFLWWGRHKGFIPWDDDLDFFMPREDYEVFVSQWRSYEKGKRYLLSDTTEDYVDRNNFATLRDSMTTQVKPYQKDLAIPHGVALDVIPLDGYPEGRWQRKFQCMWALIYSLFRAQTVPEKHGGLMAAGSRLLLGIFRGRKTRYRIWKLAKKKMTRYPIRECRYITELCSGPYYMKKKYRKEWFEKAVFVDFEERKMPFPSVTKDTSGKPLATICSCRQRKNRKRIMTASYWIWTAPVFRWEIEKKCEDKLC